MLGYFLCSLLETVKSVVYELLHLNFNLKIFIVETIQAIKPGPKPTKEDGTDDRRRRVDPPNQPKYPDLKPHIPPKPKK
jgi:hypothetical protein